jgi:predicted nucleotidyltransferase
MEPGLPIFTKLERELLSEFLDNGIDFAIIGGAAVVLHGHHRRRNDLDLLISRDTENLNRLRNVNLRWLTFKDRHIEEFGRVGAKMQDRERGVDIVTDIAGVTASDVFATHSTIEADGLQLPVIAKDLLIANKKAVGEAKDLSDIENLCQPR